ncbi:MAG: hypothetical protein OES10_13285 [Gammaproteobacteria bacterium]|nr:hypothetical protein [Gammaproteobacteria bacterium]
MNSEGIPIDVQARCVFCLDNNNFRDEQILFRGSTSYLVAPLGQLVEGYLAIAPYACGNSLSQLPPAAFPEIARLQKMVEDFYRVEYASADSTFYEQGRAGGGALYDQTDGFPYHAHLCGLAVTCDMHEILGQTFRRLDLNELADLPSAVGVQPYLYVKTGNGHCVYVGDSESARQALEHSRLTPQIAEHLGIEDRGSWRDYPGERELENLLILFRQYQKRSTGSGARPHST